MHELLLRAKTAGTPLIDGETATFVWHGKFPPIIRGDFTRWEDGSPLTFTRLRRGLWTCSMPFPADAYLEYMFILDGQRVPDPFNPHTTPSGLGKTNQYFYMPAGSPTSLARCESSIPQGAVSRYVVSAAPYESVIGRQRIVYLYQPPVDVPVPLVVVWDGIEYFRRVNLPAILDNLIAQERIRPVALAMIQNGRQARPIEYACNDATLGFLTQYVLPLAQANMRLTDIKQGNYGVLGASLGGLMALYTGLRLPHIFSHVITQSGAFGSDDSESVVYALVRHLPVKPLRIWMDVGLYDFTDIRSANDAMSALLQERGYKVALRQHNAGHNYPAWRNNVWRGLEWMFG
jgi:enterochelin esterase family protein